MNDIERLTLTIEELREVIEDLTRCVRAIESVNDNSNNNNNNNNNKKEVRY